MRVSNQMLFDSAINRLQRNLGALFNAQERLSSGKKVGRPSDDPIGYGQILNFGSSIALTDQYLRNIDRADSVLSVTESALQAVQDSLMRVNDLGIQMVSGTNSSADRGSAAREIREIYDQLMTVANTLYEGRYIFAGDQTKTKPFVSQGRYIGTAITPPVTITAGVNDRLTLSVDGVSATVTLTAGAYATGTSLASMVQNIVNADTTLLAGNSSVAVTWDTDHLVITSDAIGDTSDVLPTGGTGQATLGLSAGTNQPSGTYVGTASEIQILIGSSDSVITNLPGDRLFKGTISGTPVSGTVDIFNSSVGALQVAMQTNSIAGMNTALTNLATAMEQVSNERVLIGARKNRMTSMEVLHDEVKIALIGFKSEREDVDIAQAITDLSLKQSALEASRASAARLLNTSILDFLR